MADPRPTTILFTADQIQARIAQIAADIRRDFPHDVHFIAVLKGAFVFASDLVRHVDGPASIDFVSVSSYARQTTSSGDVRLLKDLDIAIDGKDVIIVEDIVDTGVTLAYLQERLRARNPRTLRTACLLDKPSRRRTTVTIDYVGFTIENYFVVGYGLDYAERYRNLPYIAIASEEIV